MVKFKFLFQVEPSQQLIGYNEDVKNETKYSVNGMYSYGIRDISLNDEGKYECILFPKSVAAYLTVAGENSKIHSNSKYM